RRRARAQAKSKMNSRRLKAAGVVAKPSWADRSAVRVGKIVFRTVARVGQQGVHARLRRVLATTILSTRQARAARLCPLPLTRPPCRRAARDQPECPGRAPARFLD